MAIYVRPLSPEDIALLKAIAEDPASPDEVAIRARIVLLSHEGWHIPQIARRLNLHHQTVRSRVHDFNQRGMKAVTERSRRGRQPQYTPEQCEAIVRLATMPPSELGLPYAAWSLSRLQRHLQERGIVQAIGRETIRRILRERGIVHQRFWTIAGQQDKLSPSPESSIS
jgi:transposase